MYFKERRDPWYISDFKSTSSSTFEDDSISSWKHWAEVPWTLPLDNKDFYLPDSKVDK